MAFGEEDVEHYGAEHGAESGTGPEGYALAEGYAEIAHGEAEGETANAPEGSEEDCHPDAEWVVGGEEFAEAMPLWNGEKCSQKREQKPCEDALHEPVAFPAPGFDPVDGHIAARLAEGSDGYDK